jgi:hypothetical protein
MSADIASDVAAGTLLGPFEPDAIPFPYTRVSPLGAIVKEKLDGSIKFRRIHDLSFPAGRSINDFIPSDYAPVEYGALRDVFDMIRSAGPGTPFATADIKSAYRHMPLDPNDVPLVAFNWLGKVYFEVALPFGLRSAPGLYDRLGTALTDILRTRGIHTMFRYVDDFLMPQTRADPLARFLELCAELNISVGSHTPYDTTFIYIGIEFDTLSMEARLPGPKLAALQSLLRSWRNKRKATRRELQTIGGKLAWASNVIPPGFTYTRGIFSLSARLREAHHHIRIPDEIRADLATWEALTATWNGAALLEYPPLRITLATDASSTIGAGGYCADTGLWFFMPWQPWHTRFDSTHSDLSITWKELFALILLLACFGSQWSAHSVTILCDNTGAVDIVNGSRSSSQPDLNDLCRLLFQLEIQLDVRVRAQHIPGTANTIADHLSRNRPTDARSIFPSLALTPTPLPTSINTYETYLRARLDNANPAARRAALRRSWLDF